MCYDSSREDSVGPRGPGAELLAHPHAAITRTLVEACPRLPALA